MDMTERELVGKFKRADNKKEMIEILADLNGCDIPTIEAILLENGIPEEVIPKRRGRKPKAKTEPPKKEVKEVDDTEFAEGEEVVNVPGVVLSACMFRNEVLTNQIIELTNQIKSLETERDALCDFLNGVVVDG